jgi:hypothetical protein
MIVKFVPTARMYDLVRDHMIQVARTWRRYEVTNRLDKNG